MLPKSQILSSEYFKDKFSLDKEQAPKCAITFFDWVTKKQVREVSENGVVRNLMFKPIWNLEHGQYREVADCELFSLVSEVQIERLNLSKNKKPNIVREVKEVSFPILTKLLLNDNFINSLEFMDHLNCPNLQALALMNNKITHIRSFKKTKFPNLNYIGLGKVRLRKEKNLIQNFSTISLMQTDSLNQLLIEVDKQIFGKNSNDKVMGYDITWISKIKSQQLREIKCLGKNRINMNKTKKMLCKKFTDLEIQDKYKAQNH